jgi:hypothetical protein
MATGRVSARCTLECGCVAGIRPSHDDSKSGTDLVSREFARAPLNHGRYDHYR